jgi:interferon gamma-inducible protein 30
MLAAVLAAAALPLASAVSWRDGAVRPVKAAPAAWSLDAAQVNTTLYSESLCPDCVHFETGVWNKAWLTPGIGYGTKVGDGKGIISFNQVSFGNARITPDNKTITCQHGPTECLFNTLEACAIKMYPAAFVPFVVCLSNQAGSGLTKAKAQKCATQQPKFDWNALNTCWTGAEGVKLDQISAAVTAELNPPHTFVPWVTLDLPGQGGATFCDETGCDAFISVVCKAYTGTKPPACN